MVTLYIDSFWISPYAMHVFVGLKEKGLAFHVEEVAFDRREQRTLRYLEVSRTGKVPCLVDESFSLTESLSILEYLEDRYPFPNYPSLLPRDPYERAQARQIMQWLNSDFFELRKERSTYTVFYEPTQKPLSEAAAYDAERLLDFVRPFLNGDRTQLFANWCIADTVLATTLARLAVNRDKLPEDAQRYFEEQWQRPAVAAFRSHKRRPYHPY